MSSLQPNPACPAGRRPQQVNIPERPNHPKPPDTLSPRRNQPVQYRREFKMIVGIGVFEFRVQIVLVQIVGIRLRGFRVSECSIWTAILLGLSCARC